jgi:acyl carrier protein phosphodiesterase
VNHLTHLYLADPTPDCRLGALMGDYVKGPLENRYPPEIRWGLKQHRLLDRFAESNVWFRRSKQRLCPTFRHCRGIMVDVVYDHFLARNWQDYSSMPLETFAGSIYRLLEECWPTLPPALQKAAPRLVAADWLVACRETEPLDGILRRLGARLSRPTPLEEGFTELLRNYQGLEQDFAGFMTDAACFMNDLRREQTGPDPKRLTGRSAGSFSGERLLQRRLL